MVRHCPNCNCATAHENGACLACGTSTPSWGIGITDQKTTTGSAVVGASEDTRRAMQNNPDYWIAWYTFKSLALVAVIGALGYTLGKSSR